MKILVFGSLNYDYTYRVEHFVKPGETTASLELMTFCGGKGLNQAIAVCRAGETVYLAGIVGEDGELLIKTAIENGVRAEYVKKKKGKSGHAIIQLDAAAENAILIHGGTNQEITEEYADAVLSMFTEGDLLLLQNEISCLPHIIAKAAEIGMKIILNPSPCNDMLLDCNLHAVSVFILNRGEGEYFSGTSDPQGIFSYFQREYPNASIVLTLGAHGSMCLKDGKIIAIPAVTTDVLDTTGAGDTFTGYYVSGICRGLSTEAALSRCSKAAAIAVGRMGATSSIPYESEL